MQFWGHNHQQCTHIHTMCYKISYCGLQYCICFFSLFLWMAMKIVLKMDSYGEKCPKIYLRERNERCEGGASLLTKPGMAECREKIKTDTHIHTGCPKKKYLSEISGSEMHMENLDRFGRCQIILDHFYTFGFFGPFGPFWTILDHFGPFGPFGSFWTI